jgi:hypothetical protein
VLAWGVRGPRFESEYPDFTGSFIFGWAFFILSKREDKIMSNFDVKLTALATCAG